MLPILPDHIQQAYDRLKVGIGSAEDRLLLSEWELPEDNSEITIITDNPKEEQQFHRRLRSRISQTSLKERGEDPFIDSRNDLRKLITSRPFRIAASWLMVIAIGGSIWYAAKEMLKDDQISSALPPNDTLKNTAPASNKATLTLADGAVILLDSTAKGILAKKQNTTFSLAKKGLLTIAELNGKSYAENGIPIMNTIAVPAGGEFKLVLPDGSTVWLNAASKLRFPTRFSAHKREVELEGEGFFEVSTDSKRPFQIKASQTTITVLGTSFNISSYPEETQKTTLVTGKVKLAVPGTPTGNALKPGEQGLVDASGKLHVQVVETREATGWVKGLFVFDATPLDNALRQIARWYNIEIRYEKGVPENKLYGSFPRNTPLSTALASLTDLGVHYRIDDRQIVILP